MDVVTQSLLKEFSESQKIDGFAQSDQFEAFANYIVVSDIYPEEFDSALWRPVRVSSGSTASRSSLMTPSSTMRSSSRT